MLLRNIGNLSYFQYPEWDLYEAEMLHFYTTRSGGVSPAPYHSLNMGLGTDDLPENVIRNREILAEKFSLSPSQFVFQNQVHGNKVTLVGSAFAGRGFHSKTTALPDNDAMISNERGICLMVLGADCVPILFYDPVAKAIGAAHAGWKGTVKLIARHTVEAMQEHFGCKPENILALLGPAMDVENYEVGNEVVEAMYQNIGNYDNLAIWNSKSGKYHADTWEANRRVLLQAGLSDRNIHISNLSTAGPENYFFSARRDKETGRFAGGIMLK